jgi:hypothetical protein
LAGRSQSWSRSRGRQRDRCPRGACVAGPRADRCRGVLGARPVGWASWQELGLGRGTWRRGLIWAAGAIVAVAVVYAVGAALPQTRDAFRDARYHLGWEHALLTAFLLIPLGTVLSEEVAFRGVGLAPARTRDPAAAAGSWLRIRNRLSSRPTVPVLATAPTRRTPLLRGPSPAAWGPRNLGHQHESSEITGPDRRSGTVRPVVRLTGDRVGAADLRSGHSRADRLSSRLPHYAMAPGRGYPQDEPRMQGRSPGQFGAGQAAVASGTWRAGW